MLKKEILPRLRKILDYSVDSWISAYCRNDDVSRYLYDQLSKRVNSVIEYAKRIERYECSKSN